MEWKNAEEFPPPLRKKILVKVQPYIANDDYGPYPGMAVLAGRLIEESRDEYVRREDGLYEKVQKTKRYFADVEPERYYFDENDFDWTEFSE